MLRSDYEAKLQRLVEHAWDQEVHWSQIEAWVNNFSGQFLSLEDEQKYGLLALSRFIYFGKRLVREMLKSLYRDHFQSPLIQRIRRNFRGTRDTSLLQNMFQQELASTRFVGVGNPAESGAHLLYYFRQVNYLEKSLFVDFASAFVPTLNPKTQTIRYEAKDPSVTRYVFFDDLVGSGQQASDYLAKNLAKVRLANPGLELRFMSLFATTAGLKRMNSEALFDGHAMSLFDLDDSYKAFHTTSRYFATPPTWFKTADLLAMSEGYGKKLQPGRALGYKNGQLLLGFSHNTPDNTLPIFWDEGRGTPWSPVFVRYDKNYGEAA